MSPQDYSSLRVGSVVRLVGMVRERIRGFGSDNESFSVTLECSSIPTTISKEEMEAASLVSHPTPRISREAAEAILAWNADYKTPITLKDFLNSMTEEEI